MKEEKWYVLQAIYSRALVAQKMLSDLSIETFIPMERKDIKVKGNKTQTKMVPIIRNLIFVKSTFTRIREIKAVHKYLWYLTYQDEGSAKPMVVPEERMDRFINFVEGNFDQIEYLDHETLNLKRGERVRIISGVFKDKEATFIKIVGKRSKQLVIAIDGILAVVIKTSNPSQIIEKIQLYD